MRTFFLPVKIRLLPLAVFALVLATRISGAHEAPNPAFAVNLTPAIRIGEFTTSRYLFEKNYRQFTGSGLRHPKKDPATEELNRWFALYLARLVIKADLIQQGELDRPEVVTITRQMARYMLTQPQGPLYIALGGSDPPAFRRERRAQILKESQFAANSGNISQLWSAIAPRLNRKEALRTQDVEPIGASILADYFFNGIAKRVSASDFVRDFQQGIARLVPRDIQTLSEQIEDMIVAEYDLVDAEKLGLDQTPQFLEDRYNFALNQALALYEEKLSKQLVISSAELETYHQANLRRYSSPVEIRGALFIYFDLETARRGMTAPTEENIPGLAPLPFQTIDPFIIPRDVPTPPLDVPYPFLISTPIGQRCGPFPYAGKYAVFLKRTAGEFSPLPMEKIQDQLRRDLSREKIEAAEIESLMRNLNRVQLLLELTDYKIENPLPRWRSETGQATSQDAGTNGKKTEID